MIKPGTICYLRTLPVPVKEFNGRVVEVMEYVGIKGYRIRASWLLPVLLACGTDPSKPVTCPECHLLPIDGTGPDKDVKIKLPLWMVD